LSIRLQLLGGFQLYGDDGTPIAIKVRKAKALLAYLALHLGQAQPRDKLAGLLWEESDDTRARHSLRQVLADLRRALPESDPPLLLAGDDQITLCANGIEVDALRFEALLADNCTASLEQALGLYQGELLEGFNPRSSGYEDWLLARQSHLREQALNAMTLLLERQLEADTPEPAIRTAIRLLALDPLRESVQRTLMRLYAQLGRYAAALKQYRICRNTLARELGVPPEAETQALYREMLQQRNSSTADEPDLPLETEEPPPETPGKTSDMELRQAVMLWIYLAPHLSPASPEATHQSIQEDMERTQQQLDRFGGELVNQMGGNLLAGFGMSKAHDNEPERALHASLAIQQATEQEALRPSIGIASGRITRGDTSLPLATITGEAINQANRLAVQAAPGEILISEGIYNSSRNLIQAEPRPEFSAWRLEGLSLGSIQAPTEFVGRQNELRLLSSALEICRETECGQTFLLRGDAGMGKTRLLQEVRQLAGQQGFGCHHAITLEFGSETGSSPIRSLIGSLLGITGQDGSSNVHQAIETGRISSEQEIHLNELLGLPQPKALQQLYAAMDNSTRQQGEEEVISRLIERRSEQQPLLLAVEDIHWADPRSLELLARIAVSVSGCPALLIMSTRISGEPLDPGWRGAMQGAPLTTLDLGPLRKDEALALARQLKSDSKNLQAYLDRAGGNPFFLEQLLSNTETDPAQIPDSIQHMVWARLDLLEPAEKKAIQAASVLGQRFALDALRHLLQDRAYDPAPLFNKQLLRPDRDHCQFSHALIFEGIYASLLDSKRRALHQSAAQWYAVQDLTLHARHLDRAQDLAAPAAYLAAARQQGEEFRYAPALELASRGLELAKDQERFKLLCYRGQLLRESGAIADSITAYREATRLAPDDQTAWIGLAAGLAIQDDHKAALEALDIAQTLAGDQATPDQLSQIHYYRGNSLFPLGHIDECLQQHELALQYAEQADSACHQARALSGLGDAYYQRGQMITAHGYFNRCVELCRQQGLSRIEVPNLAMRGWTAFYQNQMREAQTDARAALDMACRVGDKRAEALTRNVLGNMLTYGGELQEAEQELRLAHTLAQNLGSKFFEVDNLGTLVMLQALQGAYEEAESLAKQTYTLLQQIDATYTSPLTLGMLAIAHKGPDKKHKALDEGEAILAQECVSHNYLHFYQIAMDVALELKEWDRVKHYANKLEEYTSKEPLPWSDYFIARGRCLADIGNGGETAKHTQGLKRIREEGEQAGLKLSLSAL